MDDPPPSQSIGFHVNDHVDPSADHMCMVLRGPMLMTSLRILYLATADSECEVETLNDRDRDHLQQMYNGVIVDRG